MFPCNICQELIELHESSMTLDNRVICDACLERTWPEKISLAYRKKDNVIPFPTKDYLLDVP